MADNVDLRFLGEQVAQLKAQVRGIKADVAQLRAEQLQMEADQAQLKIDLSPSALTARYEKGRGRFGTNVSD